MSLKYHHHDHCNQLIVDWMRCKPGITNYANWWKWQIFWSVCHRGEKVYGDDDNDNSQIGDVLSAFVIVSLSKFMMDISLCLYAPFKSIATVINGSCQIPNANTRPWWHDAMTLFFFHHFLRSEFWILISYATKQLRNHVDHRIFLHSLAFGPSSHNSISSRLGAWDPWDSLLTTSQFDL